MSVFSQETAGNAAENAENAPRHQRFVLNRTSDVSGISGTGIVAEGVRFSDGTSVIRWCVGLKSTAVYATIDDLIAIHGHQGSTQVVWL